VDVVENMAVDMHCILT